MDVKIKDLGNFRILKSKLEVFTGLRFSRKLKDKEGVILVNFNEDRFSMVADMLFVFYSIDMAFLNSRKEVVDIRRNVKPFISLVVPKKNCKYLMEMKSGEMKNLKIGDAVNF